MNETVVQIAPHHHQYRLAHHCLWDACRAFFLGFILLSAGTVIAFFGFYSQFASIEASTTPGPLNATLVAATHIAPPPNTVKASYIGPVLIGIGGFILVAVGVITLETRDVSTKIVPINIPRCPRRTRKLTAQTLVNMFQTPGMRLVRLMALKAARMRSVSTQTRSCVFAISRSPRSLDSPRSTTGFKSSFKRRRVKCMKARYRLAISCPELQSLTG